MNENLTKLNTRTLDIIRLADDEMNIKGYRRVSKKTVRLLIDQLETVSRLYTEAVLKSEEN